jgi:hypothetical protein
MLIDRGPMTTPKACVVVGSIRAGVEVSGPVTAGFEVLRRTVSDSEGRGISSNFFVFGFNFRFFFFWLFVGVVEIAVIVDDFWRGARGLDIAVAVSGFCVVVALPHPGLPRVCHD